MSGSTPVFPFLTTLVMLPAAGALVAALVPRSLPERTERVVVQTIGMVTTLATLALAVAVTVRFKLHFGGYQMVSHHEWAPALGISWHLGVDGISLFLVLLTAVLFPIALTGGAVRQNPRSFVAWMLLLEAGCLGSFLALDVILFFVFFDLTLVPIYFVITGWGFERRGHAATKFFLYTFLGSAFMLVAMVALAVIHQQETGVFTFDLVSLARTHLDLTDQVLLFAGFTAAFAVKAPVFPFHTWSPDAYAAAPTGGAVALAAIMAKLGTYGIIRFDLTLFPRATVDLAPLLLSLGVAGILYGAVVACAQRDLKRLVAYSSLGHLGFVVIGIFALSAEGLAGGVLQMVNHGIVIAALFLLIGWIHERRGTWNVAELKGLQRPAPVLAAVFTVVMLAAIGLPGLNGFVGEFLILLGTFVAHRWWAVVATAGVVLAALYLLWAYQQAFHGSPNEAAKKTRDLSWREGLVVAPLVVLIVFLGIYPKPVLDRINPSVDQLVAHVDAATGTRPIGSGKQAKQAATPRIAPAAFRKAGGLARRERGASDLGALGAAGGTSTRRAP